MKDKFIILFSIVILFLSGCLHYAVVPEGYWENTSNKIFFNLTLDKNNGYYLDGDEIVVFTIVVSRVYVFEIYVDTESFFDVEGVYSSNNLKYVIQGEYKIIDKDLRLTFYDSETELIFTKIIKTPEWLQDYIESTSMMITDVTDI